MGACGGAGPHLNLQRFHLLRPFSIRSSHQSYDGSKRFRNRKSRDERIGDQRAGTKFRPLRLALFSLSFLSSLLSVPADEVFFDFGLKAAFVKTVPYADRFGHGVQFRRLGVQRVLSRHRTLMESLPLIWTLYLYHASHVGGNCCCFSFV